MINIKDKNCRKLTILIFRNCLEFIILILDLNSQFKLVDLELKYLVPVLKMILIILKLVE